VVAIDDAHGRVVGFVNMLSDGALTAFIPRLEVLPGYQGKRLPMSTAAGVAMIRGAS